MVSVAKAQESLTRLPSELRGSGRYDGADTSSSFQAHRESYRLTQQHSVPPHPPAFGNGFDHGSGIKDNNEGAISAVADPLAQAISSEIRRDVAGESL